MTNIKHLLAFNIKQLRSQHGFTQARLAEKADASTQYVAMIELGRKFPSVELLERIASAFEVDILDLFTPPPFPAENMLQLRKKFLADLEKEVTKLVSKSVQEAVNKVVQSYLINDH